MDREARPCEQRTRNHCPIEIQRCFEVHQGEQGSALGGPKVYRKPYDYIKEEVRHPAVGAGHGLESANRMDLPRVLHPVRHARLRPQRYEQVFAPNEQLPGQEVPGEPTAKEEARAVDRRTRCLG